jgi:hypothetical protein
MTMTGAERRVRSGTAGAEACARSRSRSHEDDLRAIVLRGYEGAASSDRTL